MNYRPLKRQPLSVDDFYKLSGSDREKIETEVRRQNFGWGREIMRQLSTDFIVFGVNSGGIYQQGPGKVPDDDEQRRIATEHREPVLTWVEIFP